MRSMKVLRLEAKARGELFFTTGASCAKNHTSDRYVSNGRCVECCAEDAKTPMNKELMRQHYIRNKATKLEYQKQWRQNNPEKRLAGRLRKYNLSLSEYKQLLFIQNFSCAACKTRFLIEDTKNIHVDHCHTTGKIRGILCNNCNIAIGLMKDSVENIQKLAEYLRGFL